MSFFFLKNVMLNVTLKPELLLKQFNLLIMAYYSPWDFLSMTALVRPGGTPYLK